MLDLIFVFKLSVVPILIGAVSLAEKKWGSVVAGLLASFPMVAGPIFLFLALEHDSNYGVHAAMGTLLGVVSLSAFALAYSWACLRFSWWRSLLLGWAAFVGLSLLFQPLRCSLAEAGLAAVLALAVAPMLFPKHRERTFSSPPKQSGLLLRMTAGGLLVLAVTGIVAQYGPVLAGLFTPFPIASSILAVCTHRDSGASITIALLRTILLGLFGFVAFFLVAGFALPAFGIPLTMTFALLAALMVQTVLFRVCKGKKF